MRAWILCLILVLTGCVSQRVDKTMWAPELNAEEVDFAKALAHYGQGLMIEGYQQNSSSNALVQFVSAANFDSSSYRLQSRAALESLLRGEPDLAILRLQKFCEENEESFIAWVDLARASEVAGKHKEALSAYKHATRINQTNAFLYAAMAGVSFRTDDDESAISFLKDGIRHTGKKKDFLGICHNQGREFILADRLNRAVTCFEFLVKNSTDNSHQYNYLLGEIYRRLDDKSKAMRSYYLASKQASPLPDSFIRLAILQAEESPKKSVKTLERGVEELPGEPLLLLALAYAYKDSGRIDDFINTFDAIVDVTGKSKDEELSPEFYLTYAAACDDAGRNDAAQRVLRNCIEVYPDAVNVLNHLSYMWAEQGIELDKALEYIKRAVELEPNNGAFADTLGWIYYKRKEYKNALKEVTRANRLMSGHAEILGHLGDINFALDDISAAISFWSKALLRAPSDSELIRKLKAQDVDVEALLKEGGK